MVLNSTQITSKNIVQPVNPNAQRPTTYDATVGQIICCGKILNEPSFTLKSRGVVWVVSEETFKIPDDVTGLATLRTTWAHDGVFALNVGVIDPGWVGPLATAIVNFGRDDFIVQKGETFFRIIFLENNMSHQINSQKVIRSHPEYIKEIGAKSRSFSDTFLNMSTLVKEVSDEVTSLPKLVFILTRIGIVIALIAIFAPIAFSVWTDHNKEQVEFGILEKRVAAIEEKRRNQEPPGPEAGADRLKRDSAQQKKPRETGPHAKEASK